MNMTTKPETRIRGDVITTSLCEGGEKGGGGEWGGGAKRKKPGPVSSWGTLGVVY